MDCHILWDCKWVNTAQIALHFISALPRLLKAKIGTGSWNGFAGQQQICVKPKILPINPCGHWIKSNTTCLSCTRQNMGKIHDASKQKERLDIWSFVTSKSDAHCAPCLQSTANAFLSGVATFISGASGGETCHSYLEECSLTCTQKVIVFWSLIHMAKLRVQNISDIMHFPHCTLFISHCITPNPLLNVNYF